MTGARRYTERWILECTKPQNPDRMPLAPQIGRRPPETGEYNGSRNNMIWFFGRGDEVVRLETRFEQATNEYVLVASWANRPDETERFRDFAAFDRRIQALERQLHEANWSLIGQPVLLKDGWKGP